MFAAAADPASATIDPARLASITRTLASDEFEGRSPGTPGETKTVAYLVDQFKQAIEQLQGQTAQTEAQAQMQEALGKQMQAEAVADRPMAEVEAQLYTMQKLLDKEEVMEKKNVLMQPIFRDIKSAIRFMTNTEEHKLLKEYIDNRNTLI
jgi:hypothetical protein